MRRHRAELLAGAAGALLVAPAFHRFSTGATVLGGASDYGMHLAIAGRMSLVPFHISAPHPLFHIPVAALAVLVGVPWASTVVLAVAVGTEVAVVTWIARRPFAGAAALPVGLAVAFGLSSLVLDTPGVVAQALHLGDPSGWFAVAHMWNSPTETVLTPFALVLVVFLGDALRGVDGRAPRRGWALAAVTVATMLAKPTITLVLLPALAIAIVWQRREARELVRFLVPAFVVPTALVFLWQAWFLEVDRNEFGRSSLALLPGETLRATGLDRPGPMLLVAVLPMAMAVVVGGWRFVREPAVRLLLLAEPFALLALLLVNETGIRRLDGNLAKPLFMVNLVLYLLAWRFLLGRWWEDRQERAHRWWHAPVAVLLAASLLGGALAYANGLGGIELPARTISERSAP